MNHLQDRLQVLAQLPGRPAIGYRGEWLDWGDFGGFIARIERILDELGQPKGAAIGCVLRNSPAHAGAVLAVLGSGRCLVTFNGHLPDGALSDDLREQKPAVILATAQDWERPELRQAAAAIGAAGLCLGEPAQPRATVMADLPLNTAVAPGTTLDGIAILMLTSGTTGKPKRVPLKRSSLERQVIGSVSGASEERDEIGIVTGSMVHIGGIWGLLGPIMLGRPICLLDKFTVEEWRQLIARHRPRSASVPAPALRMILDADVAPEDLSSLESLSAGAAAVSADTVEAFLQRYDLPVLSNYGATEFAGAVASWSMRTFRKYWAQKRGAVGRVHKDVEARIVDPETGDVLPAGREGLLELRGAALGGEVWTRTTDRAILDEDHFLWIVGRADNAIVRGGFKVHPDEVVRVLQSHPAVLEASVVGIPHERLGAVPAAALIVREGHPTPGADELGAWVRARMTAYSVPVEFRILDDLPRTPSMKISMPAVKALFLGS
ncbi:fatty acid--CoA ligase family protein [Sphingobium sp. Sx8-8]|uniref:class I adenylate-forming enzyme family protein n=1 Tax=Sphingobium sp. Sx8-8 TaxID=2933617 RepID=UPI001F56C642|nr:fatty acid--CoA ligase family protein [Sphingobium sp. Sx8-8]